LSDVAVDHQSFHEHPWLSVASFTVALHGRYVVTLGGEKSGQYVLALSQVQVLHQMFPLVAALLWRLTSAALAVVALYEAFVFRRGIRGRRQPS
jgi:hypothetical protein